MPWQRGPAAGGEKSKSIVQPGADLIHREDTDSRGRQLDPERDSVQPPADLADGFRILSRHRESRLCQARAFDEQVDRLGRLHPLGVDRRVGRRDLQGADCE